MTAYHPTEEAPTERLLLIVLEAKAEFSHEFRKISASVVRRAVSHTQREDGGGIESYYDDVKGTGFRHAYWSGNKETSMYVDGLKVYGQMDVRQERPLNEGNPYVNEVEFSCHSIKRRDAENMASFFKAYERACIRLQNKDYVFNSDSFGDQARKLALALGIKKFLVYKRDRGSMNMTDPANFIEFGVSDVEYYVKRLVNEAHGRTE